MESIARLKKFLRSALLPMPHRSGLLGVFYAVLILVLLKYTSFYAAGASQSISLWMKTVFASALLGLSVFAISRFFNRYRRWDASRHTFYLLEIVVLAAVVTLERALLAFTSFPSEHLNELTQPYWQTFLLNVGTILLIGAALNVQQSQLISKLKTAEELAENLRIRQRSLVVSDEEIKEQISQFLHNRIQSDLMVAGLQLKELSEALAENESAKLREILAKLEQLRSLDIRGLSQSLGPNLAHQDLGSSIGVLAAQYAKQMDISLDLNANSVENMGLNNGQIQLGIYRIVEQSLLNSLVHGPAGHVFVGLRRIDGKKVELTIADDGPGGAPNPKPGLGTSIIDAWVDILNGQKTVKTSPGAGYEIKILLPSRQRKLA